MNNTVLIMGQSGTGKSSSMRNLDPKTTFVINVLDKPFPFRGYKKKYIPVSGDQGNYYASSNWLYITKCIEMVNKTRPDIKTLVIDDLQYVMSMEFMARSQEKGYDKFVDLANHIWSIFNACLNCREDLYCFLLAHTEVDSQGMARLKTIGKMLDEKITLEGVVTCVLHSLIKDSQYKFLTQHNGNYLAKSPMDLFKEEYIDNDLNMVQQELIKYFSGE